MCRSCRLSLSVGDGVRRPLTQKKKNTKMNKKEGKNGRGRLYTIL